jgi:hypothetical protein
VNTLTNPIGLPARGQQLQIENLTNSHAFADTELFQVVALACLLGGASLICMVAIAIAAAV